MLRINLPKNGWHTLALQLPALDPAYSDYSPLITAACERLDAALNWLQERDQKTVALFGQQLGATVAATCAARKSESLRGLIILNANEDNLPASLALVPTLAKIPLPILDLYQESTSARAQRNAQDRAAGQRPHPYLQGILPAARDLTTISDILIARISGWLRHYCVPAPPPPKFQDDPAEPEKPPAKQ